MALWMIPAATAALGALRARNKGQNMLAGAARGGLLGGAAAYGGAALLGGGAAPAAASYAPEAFGTATGFGGAGAAIQSPVAAAAAPGLLSTAGAYAKPVMYGLQGAQAVQGLLGAGRQEAPQMAPQQITGPQALQGLVQGNEQMQMQAMQDMMKRRMSNQDIIAQMMGRRYG